MTLDSADSTRVRVLLFSVLREAVGRSELDLDVPSPATGARLLALLGARYPALARYESVIRLAVNESYTTADRVLAPGDEVALITPVSGG